MSSTSNETSKLQEEDFKIARRNLTTVEQQITKLINDKYDLQRQLKKKDDELIETKSKLTRIISLKAEADKKIAHDQDYKHQLYANVQELTSQYKQAKKENEEYRRRCEELENQLEKERKNVYTMDNKLTEAVQQREAYMTQLQILCKGRKQCYSNPNVADLSDEKRPTKLAEELSELYDNEWTDAFDELVSDNEERMSSFMLKLLTRAYQLCLDISNWHVRHMKDSISTLTLPIPAMPLEQRNKESFDNSTKKQKLHSDFELLRTEQKKTILEAGQFFETKLSGDVETACTDIIVQEEEINRERKGNVVKYIKKCVNICWSMSMHDPPVYIDLPDLADNDIPFDTNIYKPYTKSGKHVDFIVWPAVYLHKGGPMLSKGVAQGK